MKILDLDENFRLENQPLGMGMVHESFVFPSGCEVHVKIRNAFDDAVCITTRIKSSDDVMKLLLATDALRRAGVKNIFLFMPYLPYARQDRKMVDGEPLSVKVFADLINAQNYTRVTFYDVHSDVSLALINNSHSISNHEFVKSVLIDKQNYLVVSPDAGAYKKIFSLCQYLQYEDEIIICNKVRDLSNGKIKQVTISTENLRGKDCYIVDDICDGGATFSILSKELRNRNAENIFLIVSHGIFSKGIPIHGIDRVYTTNSFNEPPNSYYVNVKKLDYGLLS